MKPSIEWTEKQNDSIRAMRVDGFSWDAIAEKIGFARQTIIAHAKQIGCYTERRSADPVDDSREPLPAGSAETWGAINAGLSIAGEPYPVYQPIRGRRRATLPAILALAA